MLTKQCDAQLSRCASCSSPAMSTRATSMLSLEQKLTNAFAVTFVAGSLSPSVTATDGGSSVSDFLLVGRLEPAWVRCVPSGDVYVLLTGSACGCASPAYCGSALMWRCGCARSACCDVLVLFRGGVRRFASPLRCCSALRCKLVVRASAGALFA